MLTSVGCKCRLQYQRMTQLSLMGLETRLPLKKDVTKLVLLPNFQPSFFDNYQDCLYTCIQSMTSVELLLQIRSAMESSTSDFDNDKLQERLAKLSGGVAVLKV